METPFSEEKIELFGQLGRMRHLPHSGHLPQPALEEGRRILDDLVPLPQSLDPGPWLWQGRPDLAAHLAVYYSLLELREWIEGVGRASWYGLVTKPKIPVVFNDEQPSDELLGHISRDRLTSRGSLSLVLGELQRIIAGDDNGDRTSLTMTLLAELLAAIHDADVNPFDWVRDEQPELAAVVVLRHILDECCPWLVRTQIGPTARIGIPPAWLEPAPYFIVVLDEVVIARDAFFVRATTRIRKDQLPTEVRAGYNVWLQWGGFDHVVDDAGHGYRLKTAGSHGIDPLGQQGRRVTMRFEPTISPEARELRFTSDTGRARISQIRAQFPHGEDPDLTVVDVPDFPELIWTCSITG